ncbi:MULTISPECIES: hypothetical protein [Streptomyces]|uniref:Uncharacterized protein n=1 Tax=Streptomyces luteosporeus TaxID=173856 RepID=A0ABN3TUC1_9ACTN
MRSFRKVVSKVGNGRKGAPANGPGFLEISHRPFLWTMLVCLLAGVAGHAFLLASPDSGGLGKPVIGITLVVVAFTAFGGCYVASQRARVAIAASFLLTFLLSLSYAVTVVGFGQSISGDAKDIFSDFRSAVTLIIGFYFGSEALVGAGRAIGVGLTDGSRAQDVWRSDRDLVVSPTAEPPPSAEEPPGT